MASHKLGRYEVCERFESSVLHISIVYETTNNKFYLFCSQLCVKCGLCWGDICTIWTIDAASVGLKTITCSSLVIVLYRDG